MEHLFDFLKIHTLQFVPIVPDHLKCTICKNILIDSYFSQCGCKFCLNCVMEYLLDGSKSCPSGKEECENVVLDLNMNVTKDPQSDTQISNLIVLCFYENCDHQCRLREISDHVDICSNRPMECEFKVVGCEKCVKGENGMTSHLSKENVGHVQLLLGFLRKMENKVRHRMDSIELRLEETGELNKTCDRKWQEEKNEILTSMHAIKDELNGMKSLEQHVGNETQKIIQTNEECKNKVLCNAKAIEKIEKKMEENANNVTKKLEEISKRMKEREENIAKRLKEEIADKINRGLDEQAKEIQESLDTIIENFRQEAVVVGRAFRHKIKRMQEKVMNDDFFWKVDRVKHKRLEASVGINERIFSEYFYSHRNGYRLRLSLYPNGCSYGKGTHLSLFFQVCTGPFNEILKWPMKKKVRLAIMNQKTGQEYIGFDFNHEKLKHKSKKYFQKPETEDNKAVGTKVLISWNKLPKDDVLINDVLFIICSFTD